MIHSQPELRARGARRDPRCGSYLSILAKQISQAGGFFRLDFGQRRHFLAHHVFYIYLAYGLLSEINACTSGRRERVPKDVWIVFDEGTQFW